MKFIFTTLKSPFLFIVIIFFSLNFNWLLHRNLVLFQILFIKFMEFISILIFKKNYLLLDIHLFIIILCNLY